MSRSCIECVHNNPNDPSDLAYACLNCSWPTFAGEPTNFKSKHTTNADYIRAMSDEELAKKMSGLESFALTCGGGWPPEKWLDWLRQEVQT